MRMHFHGAYSESTVFFLHDGPKEEWFSWLPRIPVPKAK